MNIHEYQAKSILKHFGVVVPEGVIVDSVTEAKEAAQKLHDQLGINSWAVKAQICRRTW
jgi:succinyl-CoA synthetase beta subunit